MKTEAFIQTGAIVTGQLLGENRGWQHLVAIDLKLGHFTAACRGQMDLYLLS